jgi:hypothetical protein
MGDPQAVFFKSQKRRIESRLRFYQQIRVLGNRGSDYWHRKDKIIIPSLRRALELIELGSYGTCQSCKIVIPKERLNAIPGALRCAACQDVHERVA